LAVTPGEIIGGTSIKIGRTGVVMSMTIGAMLKKTGMMIDVTGQVIETGQAIDLKGHLPRTGRLELIKSGKITSMQIVMEMPTARPNRAGRKKIRAAGQNRTEALRAVVGLT
jgi:hypothetical protein